MIRINSETRISVSQHPLLQKQRNLPLRSRKEKVKLQLTRVLRRQPLKQNLYGPWKLLHYTFLIPHVTIHLSFSKECSHVTQACFLLYSRTKVSYLISDGPFFRKQLCENVSKSTAFVLQFDETGTVQSKKQCDILLRYWSVERGEVVVQFLRALFFKHSLGSDVAKQILETLQEDQYQISWSKFLNIGPDGPNVNKTIWNYLNEEKVRIGIPGLMPFIPCNLHVVHNAFKEGLSAYGSQAEELAIDIFY